MNEDPEVEMAKQSQTISRGGKKLAVGIDRVRGTWDWWLEIVDEKGNSTVWDDVFASDKDAISEAKKAILEESTEAFIGPADGKGNDKWN